MYQHQQLITTLQLNPETLSQKIKKQIADFNQLNESYKNAKALADSGDEEAKADVAEFEESLTQMDNDLCKSISMFDKNKDHYAALAANLRKKQEEKKAAKMQVVVNNNSQSAPVPQTHKQTAQSEPVASKQQQQQQQQPKSTETGPPAKKKKNIFTIVASICVAGVACYFGLPYLANINNKNR